MYISVFKSNRFNLPYNKQISLKTQRLENRFWQSKSNQLANFLILKAWNIYFCFLKAA